MLKDCYISLIPLGIQQEGCIRDRKWLKSLSLSIPCHQTSPILYVDQPHVKLTWLRTVSHGSFGYIDVALYEKEEKKEEKKEKKEEKEEEKKKEKEKKEVYVKRPMIKGKNLTSEACVQLLVSNFLDQNGFVHGSPSILLIFRLLDGSVCFAMEQMVGAYTLDRYIELLPIQKRSRVLLDVLLQLCAMNYILNDRLGMNHRDLKPSNFLITPHQTRKQVLIIHSEQIEIASSLSLTLIDFGFACIGSTDTHRADIALSNVYPPSDDCPKDGRDLYLFLGLFYIDYHHYLPASLNSLFESWLQHDGKLLCPFMRKDKESSKHWLYFMVGHDNIHSFRTTPLQIWKDLEQWMRI